MIDLEKLREKMEGKHEAGVELIGVPPLQIVELIDLIASFEKDAARYRLRLETIRALYPNAPSDCELDIAIGAALQSQEAAMGNPIAQQNQQVASPVVLPEPRWHNPSPHNAAHFPYYTPDDVLCYIRAGATLPDRHGFEVCRATDFGAMAVMGDGRAHAMPTVTPAEFAADIDELLAAPAAPAGEVVYRWQALDFSGYCYGSNPPEDLPARCNLTPFYRQPDAYRAALHEISATGNLTATGQQFARHLKQIARDALAAAPHAPAQEAPDTPAQHQGMTIAGNGAAELGKLMREQRDSRMGVYPDGNPNSGQP